MSDTSLSRTTSFDRSVAAHTWRPLLAGAERSDALAVANEIGRAVLRGADETHDASLSNGLAGFAVLFAELHPLFPGDGYDAAAINCAERAGKLIASARMSPALYWGFSGVAWAISYVNGRLRTNARDRLGGIDEILSGFLRREPWRGLYDLISGLAGFGVYARERRRAAGGLEMMRTVVSRLAELAEAQPESGGLAWRTFADRSPLQQRPDFPSECFDLGMAHGVAGLIAMLAASHEDDANARAGELLDGAMRWLLVQREAQTDAPGFPAFLSDDRGRLPTRVAWCYGDAGVAAAMHLAARRRNPAWEPAAHGVALRACERLAAREDGIVDAGLCHGAAGVGHVLNRIYQASGDQNLSDAARECLGRALRFREPGGGVAGFRSYVGGDEQPWIDDPGLLTGASGIALALVSATTECEPTWDRLLLLS
jgi:hypothetical protein